MADAAGEATSNEELTWHDLTVPQLKEELTMRSLETTGKKADLIARLEQYDRDMSSQQKQEEDNGDEFVVWNVEDEAEPDSEFSTDGAKKDEDKVEDDETSAAEDAKASMETSKTEPSKSSKEAEKEFSISGSKDKDLMYLTFSGKQIIIPFKDEVLRDLKHASKQQNIIMYPVYIPDLYSEAIRPLIERAVNVSTELDETVPGNPIKGYLRLKFGSAVEATKALEILKEYRHDGQELTLKHFAEDDSEGHILSKIKKEDSERRGPLVTRLVYVGNLPSDVTEEAIKSCFDDAVRVILPCKEDSTEILGHAYLEYGTEADATEAAKKYRNVEIAGQKLYVIKSMTARAESFGLLKDGLRKYWLDQIRIMEASKAKSHGKSSREIEALDTKLLRMKRRIKNDNDKRELMALPIPESEVVELPEGDEGEEKPHEEKPTERSSHGHSRSAERRRSPPRRRFSPPPYRGRSSSRVFRGGPSGSYGRGGPGSDRIVDQIQELVGALAQRERSSDYGGSYRGRGSYYDGPSRGSRGGYGGDYRGDYHGSSGRFGGKRPGDDYGGDRKRHESDSYYGGGRGGYGSSYSGSRRGGSSYY